ncbi:hypothetical protein ACUH9O_08710 [Dermabacteraceae bacterium P13103]
MKLRLLTLIPATLLLAACGATNTTSTPQTAPEQPKLVIETPSPTPTVLDGIPVTSSAETDGEPVPQEAGEADRREAVSAAMRSAEILVQGSTMDQVPWRKALDATFVEPYVQNFTTWGYKVPAHKITGEPTIQRANAATAVVIVPTDAGPLTITVVRLDAKTWLTSAIATAEGVVL